MDSQDPTQASQELLALLKRHKQCYVELKRLAEQQRALIQAEQSEALLGLLARRQKIVETIGRLHGELSPYQARWDTLKERIDSQRRKEIEGLLGDLQSQLTELLNHDRQDCEELFSRKNRISERLASAVKGRAATQAYGVDSRLAGLSRSSSANFDASG